MLVKWIGYEPTIYGSLDCLVLGLTEIYASNDLVNAQLVGIRSRMDFLMCLSFFFGDLNMVKC